MELRTLVGATGAFIDYRRLDMTLSGKTTGQRKAILHNIADELVKEALALGGAVLAIETLDFRAKKARLNEVGCAREARRLSSFAYKQFAVILKAHARPHGVAVVEVNPAYTSVIGAALHAVPNGLTVHGAAAMAIARRAMAAEETVPSRMRLWQRNRRPLVFTRPSCLRSKATVDPYWPGWKVLSNAVHAARKSEQNVRPTGKERRGRIRLLADSTIPY